MCLDAARVDSDGACPFCTPALLAHVLTETPRLRLVADHAPLVEGHLLIIPREHFACYGTVPLDYEDELVALKRRVARFFRARYRPPMFFEHGVFRQTVFHAHLHAIPFGPVDLLPVELLEPGGRPVRGLADLRAWYSERGHYFYVERARRGEDPGVASVFPPDEQRYFRALYALREQAEQLGGWRPQPERRAHGGPIIAALTAAWQAFEREAETESGAPPVDAPAGEGGSGH
jgi:diadenosine tetraphosphate (Ap4A) HIT family hydrolase